MNKEIKVHLISATPNPREILRYCWEIINSPGWPDANGPEDTSTVISDFLKSGLSGGLEMIQFVFGFEGVTRAFTHQLVRVRLASYMQQSQRFTKFEDGLDVKKPESIKNDPTASANWDNTILCIEDTMLSMHAMGIPTEDIRGLYPTNIKTNIIQCISYSSLRHMLSHRMCTQAQKSEWVSVTKQIKAIVTNYDYLLGSGLKRTCELTGKCAFDTSLDRECPIRDTL